MRLLITTQAVDLDDPILGFFHRWLEEFAKHCEKIHVICLREGRHQLPAHVIVHSLGKEAGKSKLTFIARFFRYAIALSDEYDAVFVHMNPEYVVLGGLWWRLTGKRIGFWYNHASRTMRLHAALVLSHIVFHTSPFSASASSRKSHLMPAGIDTDTFRPHQTARKPLSIYYQGRVAPAKKVALLCEAVKALRATGLAVCATIVGPDEHRYREQLQRQFDEQDGVRFLGEKPNNETPALFAAHAVSVNLASRGGLDKTVLESLACETPVVCSSDAFGDVVPPEMRFIEGDCDSLVTALQRFFALPERERQRIGGMGRSLVIERHSLRTLADRLIQLLAV